MSATSSIEWTDATWNPVRGCSRVSQGCVNCYAESVAARFSGPGLPYEGLARMTPSGPRWTGKVELIEKHLADPLRWKKPRRVFVNSMSDLFHEALPDEAIDLVFETMVLASKHTFQILTKRPARMRQYIAHALDQVRMMEAMCGGGCGAWPLPNVWLGVSVEDQATADERIPLLLQTPAAVRFVSYEPALGPVDFDSTREGDPWPTSYLRKVGADASDPSETRLDWVIVGGESGPHARPFDIAWARSTIEQCKAAGVACFVKQMGSQPFDSGAKHLPVDVLFITGKGGDQSEWPDDLRVRQFPEPKGASHA